MTEIRHLNPGSLHDPRPLGYSQAALVVGPERFVFISGQLGDLQSIALVCWSGFHGIQKNDISTVLHCIQMQVLHLH